MRADLHPDSPPTEEELRAARRLAEALESERPASGGDDSAGVVGLLHTAAREVNVDEVALRRLRGELVARASRRRGRPLWRPIAAAAAAAAAVGLVAILAGRMTSRPAESLLAQREQMARAALSTVAATGGNGVAGAYETRWQVRSESNLERARYQRLTGFTASDPGVSVKTSSRGGDS